MRKFYTKNDYEYLASLDQKRGHKLSAHPSTYKVNIPKQLRLEPWDLYADDDPHGIQLEHVLPPFGRDADMDAAAEGPAEGPDVEDEADDMDDTLEARGTVRNRDDIAHAPAMYERDRKRRAHTPRPPVTPNKSPPPPTGPSPVSVANSARFNQHTQHAREAIRRTSAATSIPEGLGAGLPVRHAGKRKGP
jgi:hypothetical protein